LCCCDDSKAGSNSKWYDWSLHFLPSLVYLPVEIAAGIAAAMRRRIYKELINYPMLFKLNATAAALTPG
jgi:hypothetical protein